MAVAIQGLLVNIDCLRLPAAFHRDIERILVRQAGTELPRALPWQAGQAARTACVSVSIGEAFARAVSALHQLKLAALLPDLGFFVLSAQLRQGKTRSILPPISLFSTMSSLEQICLNCLHSCGKAPS